MIRSAVHPPHVRSTPLPTFALGPCLTLPIPIPLPLTGRGYGVGGLCESRFHPPCDSFRNEDRMTRSHSFYRLLCLVALCLVLIPGQAQQSQAKVKITLDDPVIEPLPYAVPDFIAENGGAGKLAQEIARVVADDLTGTGLFREVPAEAYISKVTSFDAPVAYGDWQAINAQALITGSVSASGDRVVVKFRLYDIFSGEQMGEGLQFAGSAKSWRRMAHKVADAAYSRITGEGGYFDSRVVYVAESGPKDARQKRLAVMDYDGANVAYLTDSASIVLAPRFSPTGDRILFTSYATGFPRIYLMDTANLSTRVLAEQPGTMTFAPRFAPDGRTVVFSLEKDGNADIYALDSESGSIRQLTNALNTDCYSSDLQQVAVKLRVLYRIPEASVVRIYTEYSGDPFDNLIAPRVQEAIKEVAALQSAEMIVKKREDIKIKSLAAAREKIGQLLILEDLVIEDLVLSKELETAIESKMVQEQEAAKARFTQQKAQIEADTAIIRAKGEAEAIRIRAEAIRDNPGLIQLQIVEKWDGRSPLVIGGGMGESGGAANILLPLNLPATSAPSKK